MKEKTVLTQRYFHRSWSNLRVISASALACMDRRSSKLSPPTHLNGTQKQSFVPFISLLFTILLNQRRNYLHRLVPATLLPEFQNHLTSVLHQKLMNKQIF